MIILLWFQILSAPYVSPSMAANPLCTDQPPLRTLYHESHTGAPWLESEGKTYKTKSAARDSSENFTGEVLDPSGVTKPFDITIKYQNNQLDGLKPADWQAVDGTFKAPAPFLKLGETSYDKKFTASKQFKRYKGTLKSPQGETLEFEGEIESKNLELNGLAKPIWSPTIGRLRIFEYQAGEKVLRMEISGKSVAPDIVSAVEEK